MITKRTGSTGSKKEARGCCCSALLQMKKRRMPGAGGLADWRTGGPADRTGEYKVRPPKLGIPTLHTKVTTSYGTYLGKHNGFSST